MKLDTIYVIHHTHTDIGFTNDQPIFWEMHHRFINDALRLMIVILEMHSKVVSDGRWKLLADCKPGSRLPRAAISLNVWLNMEGTSMKHTQWLAADPENSRPFVQHLGEPSAGKIINFRNPTAIIRTPSACFEIARHIQ